MCGLDELRRHGRTGVERMLVILGASGCGKSSFLIREVALHVDRPPVSAAQFAWAVNTKKSSNLGMRCDVMDGDAAIRSAQQATLPIHCRSHESEVAAN